MSYLYYNITTAWKHALCASHNSSLWIFVINSAIRKIVDTKSQDVVDTCRYIFNCIPSEAVFANRICNFLGKISVSENKLCSIFVANAVKELSELRQG